MIKREKSRGIKGSYQVVFEACVRTVESFLPDPEIQSIMGTKRLLRIQAAHAQAGTITASASGGWRIEMQITQTTGECHVSITLISLTQKADPFGVMFHWIDTFFDTLESIIRDIISQSREV